MTFFKQFERISCELVDPYFYHLDTCFCPLNDKLAIWYPNAFSKKTQRLLMDTCELISVSDDEAKHFACNAVVINNQVIIPSGCSKLKHALEAHGFIVYSCDMSEYIKAGGACKCLTLKLTD